MRLGHRQPYGITGRLDIVGDEAFRQLAEFLDALHQPCAGEAARRRPLDDLAANMDAAV
jgi:hypothetical protein